MFHPQGPTFLELARQALSSTERGYDLLAEKFDYTPFRTPQIVLGAVAEHLKGRAPYSDALDVCCGTGAAVEMLLPYCQRRIVGIDFSQGMLDQAHKNLANVGQCVASMEWVNGDVLDMPFEREFDLVVCFGALGHFLPKEQEQLLDQIKKALRIGGRFVFVTTYMPRFFSINHLFSRGFNFAMRLRNLLFRPPFIMYYLTFLLPQVRQQLEARGFSVEEIAPYEGRLKALRLVDAKLEK